MPERIVSRLRGFSPNLYFKIPFETKKRFGIKRGDIVKCTLKRITDSDGNVIKNVDIQVQCKVLRKDDCFYLNPRLVQELNLFGGEYYELILQKVVKKNGKEVEIYPGKLVDAGKEE